LKKRVLALIAICVLLFFVCDKSNEKKEVDTYVYNIDKYKHDVKISEKSDCIVVDSSKIKQSPDANMEKSNGNLEDESFICSIKQLIKEGKILNTDCKKFYILTSPIHELCYNIIYSYEISEEEDKEASGVRYIIASDREFSDAEVVIYTGDESKVRKEYQLSGDVLKFIIDNKEEYGIMLAENRVVLVDKEDSITEQYVGDKLFNSTDGDCFSVLKEKGLVLCQDLVQIKMGDFSS